MSQDVLLVATDADGRGRLPVRTFEKVDHLGARCIFFPRLPGESLKLSPALSCWLRANVEKFDVVHVHSIFSHPSLAAGRAAARAGIPYIVRTLGQLDTWSLSQHALRKKLFLAAAGKRLLQRAAAMHWTDESERVGAPRFASERPSFVLPLGVDDELFDGSDDAPRDRTVLLLSRLHPKKNVEGLVEAFQRLGDVGTGWRLVIAGDGEPAYVESLRRLAAGAEGRIEFLGWLSGEKKRQSLRTAALLALPSRQENFGIAVAEAMAAGTPVVVSEAVALAAEVERAGSGWVAPLDPEGLARVLATAMSSAEERSRRGRAARTLACEKYRWGSVACGLVAEYERISTGRGRAE